MPFQSLRDSRERPLGAEFFIRFQAFDSRFTQRTVFGPVATVGATHYGDTIFVQVPELKKVVVLVTSEVTRTCPIENCHRLLDGIDHFEDACNHLLQHGLTCVHVGTQTDEGPNGQAWHVTIAVFGE